MLIFYVSAFKHGMIQVCVWWRRKKWLTFLRGKKSLWQLVVHDTIFCIFNLMHISDHAENSDRLVQSVFGVGGSHAESNSACGERGGGIAGTDQSQAILHRHSHNGAHLGRQIDHNWNHWRVIISKHNKT